MTVKVTRRPSTLLSGAASVWRRPSQRVAAMNVPVADPAVERIYAAFEKEVEEATVRATRRALGRFRRLDERRGQRLAQPSEPAPFLAR